MLVIQGSTQVFVDECHVFGYPCSVTFRIGAEQPCLAFDEVDGVSFESFQSFFYLTISSKDLFSLADQLLQ